jgi:diacylglycerol kinase (ATP)
MKTFVIHNPYANRWNAQKRLPEIHAALKAAGLEYDLVSTQGPGQAIELASQAVHQGYDAILAAGGDGTISEVVNGICQAVDPSPSKKVPVHLGILPLGTANDLVVNLGLPTDLQTTALFLQADKTRFIDLGTVTYKKEGIFQPLRYFDNNSAIGLEPTVTLVQQRITWMQGTLRYLLAALLAIARNPQWVVHLEWEDGKYDGPCTLVTVGNTPVTGGLFYMTPHANPADGKLTFVYAYMNGRLAILRIFPRTMKSGQGSYVEHPAVHEVHTSWLRIRVEQPTPLHADGEIQTETAQEIEYRILEGVLPMIVP